MPLYEAEFVSQYWNSVFATFLEGLEQGLTPNPDLACNSHIKFGALLQFARQKGADVLATGHYARIAWRRDVAGVDAAAGAAADDIVQQQQQQQQQDVAWRRDAAGVHAAAGAAADGFTHHQQQQQQDVALRRHAASVDAAAGDAAGGHGNSVQLQQQQQQQQQQQPVLLSGVDPQKDQTYFLAGLTQQQLESATFPVGGCACWLLVEAQLAVLFIYC
jgi:tRNA U34 2-thiouridine synthase MnmA/TrmU